MREITAQDRLRTADVVDVSERLVHDFPELPAGAVLGQVLRARRDLRRLGPCEGLAEAVELVSRQRLLDLVALRCQVLHCAGD